MNNTIKKIVTFCLAAAISTGMGMTAFAADDTAAATESTTTTQTHTKGDRTGGGRGIRVNAIEIAATTLGKTVDEVKAQVETGKIGDLLIAAGKVDAFKTAYLSQTKTKLDAGVTAGTITQAVADEKYATAQTKIATYDGTTHLCGQTDHTKMLERKDKATTTATTTTEQAV